jgi:hypothetical protein
MKILQFSDSENWDISKLLAAILHLGNVGFMGNVCLNNTPGKEEWRDGDSRRKKSLDSCAKRIM